MRRVGWLILVGAMSLSVGCPSSNQREVVVYTALDREFSEAIFADFERTTGITVRAKYDTEANKTVGLANLILNERQRPRCDLFWNNEILNTLRLDRAGALRAYRSPHEADYAPRYRSTQQRWYGFAARGRVLLVNHAKVPAESWPRSIRDLVDPRWQGQVGIAKPLFGTTATHAACLFATWGRSEAETFFRQIHQNAHVLAGNRQVAQAVGTGKLSYGLTDTDDAVIEIEQGRPVTIVYPDQEEGGLGTLFIPNTLALMTDSPHPHVAEQLLDYLLDPQIERRLAEGRSAQIPLNQRVRAAVRVETPETVREMQANFERAAEVWDTAAAFLRDEFTTDRGPLGAAADGTE